MAERSTSAVVDPPASVADRNNNPLNIKYGPATKYLVDSGIATVGEGATDGGKFLTFKDPSIGFMAADDLLGGYYADHSVDAALRRWSNGGYGGSIFSEVAPTATIKALTSDQRSSLLHAMAKQEGWHDRSASPTTSDADWITVDDGEWQTVAHPEIAPTLLASRQAASTSTFNRHIPAENKIENAGLKTVLDAPLDFGIGLEKTFGLDPMHPIASIPEAAKGIAVGVGHLVTSPVETGKALWRSMSDAVSRGGTAIREGNIPAAMQAVGEGYGMAKPVAEIPSTVVATAKAIPKLPETLMTQAAGNRTPLPPANLRSLTGDLAVTAGGYAIGGKEGAAIAEALNLVRKSPMFRNAKASIQEAAARFLAGKPDMLASATAEHAPVGEIVSPVRPSVVAADEAARLAQAPILPREVYSGADPIDASTGYLGSTNPPVEIPRPGTPEFIKRQIEEARIQAEHENYPSGELKPAPTSTVPIEMPGLPTVTTPRTPTVRDITTAEQAIRPVGLGQRSTMFNVPKLLNEAPELIGIRKGPNFDARLTDAFTQREAGVITAETKVPRETLVPNPKDQIAVIKTEYDADPHMQQTAAKLGRIIEQWEALPDQVPWEQFRDAKRSFFEENRTSSAPMRRVYHALMDVSKGISPELDAANRSYSIVRRAMDDANIETSSKVIEGQSLRGRRIKDVGKTTKPTLWQQIQQTMPAKPAIAETERASLPTKAPEAAMLPSESAQKPLLGETPSEALTIAAAGRRPILLRESKAFDTQGLVDSPLFQGRGGAQGFLPTDARTGAVLPVKTRIGAALFKEPRGLTQMVNARLQQVQEAARSGVTETTGKALGKPGREQGSANIGTESVRRGGGILTAFPELKMVGAGPKQIAEAIERGEGALFQRVRKAIASDLRGKREWSPESGPEPLAVRAKRVFELRRQSSPEPPF